MTRGHKVLPEDLNYKATYRISGCCIKLRHGDGECDIRARGDVGERIVDLTARFISCGNQDRQREGILL